MDRTLDVYLHEQLVGLMVQDDNGDMVFDYNESWINNPNAMPLSLSLPLRKERYSRRECEGFFDGILPEDENRRIIARNLGISAKNDFAMLEKIGGECAGAVTFIPSGNRFPEHDERYHHLSDTELANILRILPRRPLMAGEEDIRLSLAGAQDKIAVHIAEGRISIPLGGAPSTHILKPAIELYEGMVFNESICMNLAHAIGLPTTKTEISRVEEIDYLLVKRYDRTGGGDIPLKRLHQEDFCQALGIVSEHKYQNEGGPSLKQCFQLIRETSSIPVNDLQSLLDGIIFNFLIGNNDAHGKNFSLIYDGGTRLAPFYDMLCTVYYHELSKNMAMKIGGEYVSDKVTIRHFERFTEEAGLGKPMVKRRLLDLAEMMISKLPEVTTEHPVVNEVARLIHRRCVHARQRFTE